VARSVSSDIAVRLLYPSDALSRKLSKPWKLQKLFLTLQQVANGCEESRRTVIAHLKVDASDELTNDM
jgi:hypothetical protein